MDKQGNSKSTAIIHTPYTRVLKNRKLLRVIFNFIHVEPTYEIADGGKKCTYKIQRRYRDWHDSVQIIRHGHWGLLIDKLSNDMVTFNSLAVEEFCKRCNDINVFHNIYQTHRNAFLSPSLIQYAVQGGNIEIVKLLVEQTNPIQLTPKLALEAAVSTGNIKMVEYLVSKAIQPVDQLSLGFRVIESGDASMMKWLKENMFNYMNDFIAQLQYSKNVFKCGDTQIIKSTIDKYNDSIKQQQQQQQPIKKVNFVRDYVTLLGTHYHDAKTRINILETIDNGRSFDSVQDIYANVKKTVAGLGIEESHPQYQQILDYLSFVEILMVVSLGDVKEGEIEYIIKELVEFKCNQLMAFCIDMLEQSSIAFDTICKYASLDQINTTIKYIGNRRSLISARGLINTLVRSDEQSQVIAPAVFDYIKLNAEQNPINPSTNNSKGKNNQYLNNGVNWGNGVDPSTYGFPLLIPRYIVQAELIGKIYNSYDMITLGYLSVPVLDLIIEKVSLRDSKAVELQLRHAVLTDNLEMFRKINERLRTKPSSFSLELAIRYGHTGFIDYFLEWRIKENQRKYKDRVVTKVKFDQDVYAEIGSKGDINLFEEYYLKKAIVNDQHSLIIARNAIYSGQVDLTKYIVDKVNDLFDKCIIVAISQGYIPILNTLRGDGGKDKKKRKMVNFNHKPYLLEAIAHGHVKVLKWLLDTTDDKKVLSSILGVISEKEFVDTLFGNERLEMFYYLASIGFPFTTLNTIQPTPPSQQKITTTNQNNTNIQYFTPIDNMIDLKEKLKQTISKNVQNNGKTPTLNIKILNSKSSSPNSSPSIAATDSNAPNVLQQDLNTSSSGTDGDKSVTPAPKRKSTTKSNKI